MSMTAAERQVTTQKPTADVSTSGAEDVRLRWMDDRWFGIRLSDGNQTGSWKLKLGGDDRETGTGLPSVCWLSLAGRKEREAKRKSNTKVRGEEEEKEKARRRQIINVK